MAVRQTGRKVYKSMQGKTVDMDLLRQKNELTPAVGNARVNARGDELGPGGKIVRKREDVLEDYYRDTPNQVPDEAPVAAGESEVEHKADAVEKKLQSKFKKKKMTLIGLKMMMVTLLKKVNRNVECSSSS